MFVFCSPTCEFLVTQFMGDGYKLYHCSRFGVMLLDSPSDNPVKDRRCDKIG